MDFASITPEEWIGIIAFVIGLVFVAGAAFRKQAGWKMNPMFSAVIGVVLIVAGGAIGIMPLLPEETDDGGTTTTIVVDGNDVDPPTFEINVNPRYNGDSDTTGWADCDEDDTDLQLLLYGSDADYVYQWNASTSSKQTFGCLNFTFKPIPTPSSTTENLATIYFKTDYDITYGGEDFLDDVTGASYQDAHWNYTDGGSDYISGVCSLEMTESGYANLTYTYKTGTSSAAYEAITDATDYTNIMTWYITFSNDPNFNGWTKTYKVTAMFVGDGT